jgi:ketosteroid isomerase-like protein
MSISELPSSIKAFLRAARARDAAALMSTLDPYTVLIDPEGEHRGGAIQAWAERLCAHTSLTSLTVRPIGDDSQDGEIVLTMLAGGDKDPRAVDVPLDWRFKLESGRILTIRIAPREMPALPAPVAAYVRATNQCDLEALLATFVDDALVNDQLRDYWGTQQIRSWASRDIIGERLTMRVINVTEHYGHIIVTAHVDGDFDKRGLPDPLVLAFYFSAMGDKIVQLIILRNQSGT